MVPRCAYYINDNSELVRHHVLIEWDLGFTKEAKHKYINRIIDALNMDDKIMVDVTSASYIYDAQHLSPLFVKLKSNSIMSVEDYIGTIKLQMSSVGYGMRVKYYGYIYLASFADKEIRAIEKYDGFFDVFNNPLNTPDNSQAYFCAVYKLMMRQKKTDVLQDFSYYLEYLSNIKVVDVIQEQEVTHPVYLGSTWDTQIE